MLVARCSVSVLLFQVSWKLLPVDLEAQFNGMPASQCILHAHTGRATPQHRQYTRHLRGLKIG